MQLLDVFFGKPLATYDENNETIGSAAGVPIFGLDALSSAAYGPEAALTILIPLGAAGLAYIVPISTSIIVLLAIVYFSYRQTIAAYPGGGGSYTVASANLGARSGLLAAAALMIDYTLDVAVGISAGVGALVSGVPRLQPHTLGLCLGILFVLTLINLRGPRAAGVAFMLPTYAFVGCLLTVIVIGVYQTVAHGGHPTPVQPPPSMPHTTGVLTTWLLLKAFASGCTAMTGVEAVSNGVTVFRQPRARQARATLTIIIATLIVLMAGIAYLVHAYGIVATTPGEAGYQSVLSMLTAAVAGKGIFYFVTIGAILVVLALSANTAFADFPRLCNAIAQNGYLPYAFTLRGRRLVYSWGIYALAFLSGGLLIIFGGVTDRLIPLFAIGAFTAFTLSQAGMCVHWRRDGGRGAGSSTLVNGVGALATGITTCVVLAAKFTDGAWITVLLIPCLILLMAGIHRHYARIVLETGLPGPVNLLKLPPPLVVLPVERWSKISEKALCFAYSLSEEVFAVHIEAGQETDDVKSKWPKFAEEPARKAGFKLPQLVVIPSPYRLVVRPILDFVCKLEHNYPGRQIAVLVPELVESHWYNRLLHNQRPAVLKALLYLKATQRVIVIGIPWYLND